MASLGGINSNGLNFSGLATGIDSDKLVSGLTKINQARIDTLKARQSDIVTKQAAFAALQGRLFDLQSKAGRLSRTAAGAFDGRTASSSDSTAITAAAGSTAAAGTYSLTITALAQAHQTVSAGMTDPNARIKEGTLDIQVGSGAATTITIDSQNNTLQGLADAINAAGGDVKAAVINDGSAAPYRLMLTATRTGAANTIAITNNLTTGTGADIDPAATTLQAAGDAVVKLGNGAVTVTSATNQVNGLVPGVTINLLRADATKPVTLTVAADTSAAEKAVTEFVDSFNSVQDFLLQQSAFNKDTQSAGILLGNRDTAQLADELAQALATTIPGLSGSANRLSSVGLSFKDDGKLELDKAKLTQALSGQTGATLSDLKRLFALSGTSDNPGIAFAYGTDYTKASGANPYQVTVSTPATRGAVTGANALAGSVVIGAANNTLQLKLNGLTSTGITLAAGSYTPAALATMLQQRINADASLSGNLVTVGLDGSNRLQITSQQYGTGSTVAFAGGSALADLGFAGTETGTGTDVAGTFTVNGLTEAATGSGQLLTGNAGNANTTGLQVRATIAAPGSANVTVTQGLAGRLNQVLAKYLDTANGKLKNIADGFDQNVKDLEETITRQNDMLEEKKNALILRFAAMESAVSKLKGLGSQLTALIPTINTTR